ncbi:uncharacterized protein TRUGW13939_03156 [Talaromyces rugulosus]|uniref:D-xylose reductase [NAD(P)H] n=1 Tax=Talaromyces rugulosus TaxID=121627 RepID=A0A7H8QQC1_TALRU|nr:uncharacterized protein TRUGW13939_03156 [Talaromyces rugulosus]QKX56056.1 hypothetical protein TRUGW13939_03156 [Talaromyces rugulosus]
MASGQTFRLSSGYSMPAIGLGTWQSRNDEVRDAVKTALEAGYRHIDAAAVYGNEKQVGDGIKASGVPRGEIFVSIPQFACSPKKLIKLWNTHHESEHVEAALNKSLADLQTDYLDLYLIHWPVSFRHSNESLEKHKRMNFPARLGVDIFGEVGEASAQQSAREWAEQQKKIGK